MSLPKRSMTPVTRRRRTINLKICIPEKVVSSVDLKFSSFYTLISNFLSLIRYFYFDSTKSIQYNMKLIRVFNTVIRNLYLHDFFQQVLCCFLLIVMVELRNNSSFSVNPHPYNFRLSFLFLLLNSFYKSVYFALYLVSVLVGLD